MKPIDHRLRRRAAHILLVLLPLASLSERAAAQGAPATPAKAPDAGEDARTKKARDLYVEGTKAFQKERWSEAYAAFLASWGLKKHWQIAASLGDCELRMGLFRDAAEHVAYFAKEAPPDRQAEAQEFLRKVQAKVGTVTVTVDATGAEVLVDGKAVGTSPLGMPVFVDPGRRVIAAKATGRPTAEEAIDATAGGVYDVALKVAEKKEPETPPKNGKPIEVPPPKSPWPWVAVGAGVAAVGLGMGIGFTVAANGKSDEAHAIRDRLGGPSMCFGTPSTTVLADCTAVREAAEAGDTFTGAAVAGYVIGGVATAAAITSILLWPKQRKKQTGAVSAVPWVSVNSAGLGATGTF